MTLVVNNGKRPHFSLFFSFHSRKTNISTYCTGNIESCLGEMEKVREILDVQIPKGRRVNVTEDVRYRDKWVRNGAFIWCVEQDSVALQ